MNLGELFLDWSKVEYPDRFKVLAALTSLVILRSTNAKEFDKIRENLFCFYSKRGSGCGRSIS